MTPIRIVTFIVMAVIISTVVFTVSSVFVHMYSDKETTSKYYITNPYAKQGDLITDTMGETYAVIRCTGNTCYVLTKAHPTGQYITFE